MIQTHGHGILKSSFSSSCLIVGVGFISRVLVVLEKTNNESFRYLQTTLIMGGGGLVSEFM